MGIINDINSLEPMTALKCRDFLRICSREGLSVAINETKRAEITQLIYFLQQSVSQAAEKNPKEVRFLGNIQNGSG